MPNSENIADITRQAEAAYAIRVTDTQLIGYGSGNRNYRLDTERGVFVLCLIEEQTAEEVQAMALTLQWLTDHGYPSTILQQTAEVELTVVIDGKPALLRRFLRGDVCWEPNEYQVQQVGASLAALHQLPCPSFLPRDIYYRQDRFAQALNSGHDPEYEAWVKHSLDRIEIESFAGLPRGLIHADVFADNVLFDGAELVAVIDFELACNYLLTFDLAMAIIGLCVRNNQLCFGKIKSLVAGYEATRRLDAAEIAALKSLTEYAAIMTSVWRYWRYRCHEPGHIKQYAYQEMAATARRVISCDFAIDWRG